VVTTWTCLENMREVFYLNMIKTQRVLEKYLTKPLITIFENTQENNKWENRSYNFYLSLLASAMNWNSYYLLLGTVTEHWAVRSCGEWGQSARLHAWCNMRLVVACHTATLSTRLSCATIALAASACVWHSKGNSSFRYLNFVAIYHKYWMQQLHI